MVVGITNLANMCAEYLLTQVIGFGVPDHTFILQVGSDDEDTAPTNEHHKCKVTFRIHTSSIVFSARGFVPSNCDDSPITLTATDGATVVITPSNP